jgi:Fe-S cluster biosynthesis and repair protein YggX
MDDRIERFQRMVEADPDNELGLLSLGKALSDARRFEEAVDPLRRVVELNPGQSKAYQLLGGALRRLNRDEEAATVLKEGFRVADERGDVLPRDVMGKLLESLGETPPEVRKTEVDRRTETMEDAAFRCRRCGAAAGRMADPPFSGPLGVTVHQHVCANCWNEWVGMGTKVINELRLRLSTQQSQVVYDQHMIEFLNLEECSQS